MKIKIKPEQNGKTVLEILKGDLSFPSSVITFLKTRDNGIILNGERVTVRKTLHEGDVLELEYRDEKEISELSEIKPSDISLDIIYEDDDIIALNKPPFMPTHPSHNHQEDTLANGLKHLFNKRDVPFIFRAVNRLDNCTSGIVLVAKNRLSAAKLSKSIKERRIEKSYLAIIHGCTDNDCGFIDAPIKRAEDSIITRTVSQDGAPSLTKYKALIKGDMYSVVSASPITGRTHQLRVHFSYIGHPICGDTLYGYPSQFINRQALHAYKLIFDHPTRNEKITLLAPPPKDFTDFMSIAFPYEPLNIKNI